MKRQDHTLDELLPGPLNVCYHTPCDLQTNCPFPGPGQTGRRTLLSHVFIPLSNYQHIITLYMYVFIDLKLYLVTDFIYYLEWTTTKYLLMSVHNPTIWLLINIYKVSLKKVYPSLNVSYRKSQEYFRKDKYLGKGQNVLCPMVLGLLCHCHG